jgi:hypothetical protein
MLATEMILRARLWQVEVVWPGGVSPATLPQEYERFPLGVATVSPDTEGQSVEQQRRCDGGAAGLRREGNQIGGIG